MHRAVHNISSFTKVFISSTLLTGPASMADDCICGFIPYVHYELTSDNDLYGNPWMVTRVELLRDMMLETEPLRCFAELAYDETQPVNHPGTLNHQFVIRFNGELTQGSDFEWFLKETNCLLDW